jgi:ATP-binding cassette subfamily B protein/subfamily B ATP-binding cassette protein MsbA
MKNFFRVIRLSLRYKWTVVGTLICALAVGLLWGANLGVVFPFVEVVLKGRTLQEWVDTEIDDAEKKSTEITAKITELEAKRAVAAEAEQVTINNELHTLAMQLEAEQSALATRRWLQPFIHEYLPDKLFSTVVLLVAVLLIGTLIKVMFLSVAVILTERVTHLGTLYLRKEFFRRTLRMEMASFNESGTSDLMSRFTHDIQQIAFGLRVVFGKAIREPLKMACCLIAASWVCWRLLLFTLILAPLAAWLIAMLGKSVKRANRRAMEDMSVIYNALSEAFRGIKVVKAFTMERHERRRFHDANKTYFRKSMRIALYDSLIRPATELMGICTISLAILGGSYLVLNEETHLLGLKMTDRAMGVSSMLLFFGFLAGVSDPARKLSDVVGRLQRAAAAADRIYDKLDRESKVCDPAQPVPAPRHTREIVFDNVHFRYADDGEEVLKGVSLTIPFGQTVAVVGPNGCGKSTLANLIPRFFDPVSGEVRIDDVSLTNVRVRDHRSQIGIVTQETLLFNDTVAANIRYGKSGATHEEIVNAAQRAHADKFIEENLEHGYETVVGENASRISGGQRQRIALARAILRDPRILILDEATSQVDLQSEQVINRVLAEFMQDRTAVIITHRMSLIELADCIVVMQAGKILDSGTHAELCDRCELYSRLYQLDFRASA